MNKLISASDGGSFSVAITGSGGSGAVTTGRILLEAIAVSGFQGLMTRSAGPQIRGGESAAMVRFGAGPVECMGDYFHVLVGLDWLNVERFADEIPLTANSLVLGDVSQGEVPERLLAAGAKTLLLPFKGLAGEIEGGRINMVALGVVAATFGLSLKSILQGVERVLAAKGDEVVASANACVSVGYKEQMDNEVVEPPVLEQLPNHWSLSGNEAAGLGALRGGVRFVAAYPITPASEILEWLAPNIERLGGNLLQAEDELASINMIIGSSFGGVPSLTATSGPGLSLMVEGLGLALVSETPLTVINVMRGGPSTGIPTKSEQSDLNIALYGLHGDAPHLVLAAISIRDCVFTTQWAVQLAEELQTVSIVLSDQSLGQSRAICLPPQDAGDSPGRNIEEKPVDDYRRYALTDSGISPMALPGAESGMYTADGLEHNERGTPSSMANDHRQQMDKRLRKLQQHEYGDHWAEIRGQGDTCIITWGSTAGAAFEAALGRSVRAIAIRLLMPLAKDKLSEALRGVRRIVVVEQNHGAQLLHYLRAQNILPVEAESLAHPGPLPVRPGEIVQLLQQSGGEL